MAAETGTSSAARGRGESVTRRMFRLAWEMTSFKIGLGVFTVLVGAAIIWPELSPYDPMRSACASASCRPSSWRAAPGPYCRHGPARPRPFRALAGGTSQRARHRCSGGRDHVRRRLRAGRDFRLLGPLGRHRPDAHPDAQLSIPVIVLAITILSVSPPQPVHGDRRAGAGGVADLCPRGAKHRARRARARIREGGEDSGCERPQDRRADDLAQHPCRPLPSSPCSTSPA